MSDVDRLVELGDNAYVEKSFKEAAQYYVKALEMEPNSEHIKYNLALVSFEMERYDLVQGLINEIFEIDCTELIEAYIEKTGTEDILEIPQDASMDYLTFFKTGKVYEFDLIVEQLDRSEIPFRTQNETIGGLSTATGIMPNSGPGIWQKIEIPIAFRHRAHLILAGLNVDPKTNPDVWDNSPTEEVKKGLKLNAAMGIIIFGAILIAGLVTVILDIVKMAD